MKMASRSIDLTIISKKTNCMCSTPFFLIRKKTNLQMQHAFCLSVLLFCTTTTLFCRTKLSNVLVTHYFYGGIAVCAYPIHVFCLMCSCSLLFFTALICSPCWPLALLIASPVLWIVMFFFLQNSSLLFSITRSSSFSVIHVSVNIKNNVEKDMTLLLFFLS